MAVWDESAYLAYCDTIRANYREAGRYPDDHYPVWPGRATFDYASGALSWDASCAKHLAECRAALGFEPPDPPLTPLLPLRPGPQAFERADGSPFTAIQCSDFNLLNRWQHGEDVTAILSQRARAGFNMLRVWTLYDLADKGIGRFLDIDYARVPDFLALCASYGLYVEFTAYTSLERPEHWGLLGYACKDAPNVLLELVNEGDLPVNAIDMNRYGKIAGVLCSHGSSGAETNPLLPYWDYVTFHTNGASEEQRKVGHNAMELWSGPTLTNETSRYADVGMWRGASLDRQQMLAYDSAAGASLLCAGSCFHSVEGKASVPWGPATTAVAIAWVNGALSVNPLWHGHPYTRRDDLLAPGILRAYQRGDSPAVLIHA